MAPRETPSRAVRTVPARSVLRVDSPDLIIGNEDTPGPTLFGNITSIAIGSAGEIIVADHSDNTIRIFDSSGAHAQTFGRRGRGPGEFLNPLVLRWTAPERLLALQLFFGATELHFERSQLSVVGAFGAGLRYTDACRSRGTTIVSGWIDGHLLHELGADGNPVRSWGDGWSRDTVLAVREADNATGGMLLCDDASGDVLIANAGTGVVRRYTANRALSWEIQLPSFRYSFRFTQPGPNGGRAVVLGYGEDHIASMWFLDATRLVVQVRRTSLAAVGRVRGTQSAVPPTVTVTSYLIDRANGQLTVQMRDLPAFVAVEGGRGYGFDQEPFPQVTRRRLREP